jgi:hypothetical protein
MFEGWTGPEVTTFWIALGALLVALSSLGWQAWTWRRSGAIVRVTANQSLPMYSTPAGQQPGDWQVDVTATNKGRGPATVVGWGFRAPGNNNIVMTEPLPWSSPLPFTLEAGGATGSWYISTDEVMATCRRESVRHQDLKAWVRLSDGRRVYAKRKGIGRA